MAIATMSPSACNEPCPQAEDSAEESAAQAARQVWWTFELNALAARFGNVLLRCDCKGPGNSALLEVDLSNILGYFPRSVTIMVLVPPDYPNSRPVVVPTDRCGCLDREQLQELTRCTAKSVDSAASTNGPSVFFAIDQATSLVRTKFSRSGSVEERCEHREAAKVESRKEGSRQQYSRRSRRKKGVMAALTPPLPETPPGQKNKHQEALCSLSVKARGLGSVSTNPGHGTPSYISDHSGASGPSFSSSSGDTDCTDSSSSSSSSEDEASDDEMAAIEAQLHLNVRQRLLLKRTEPKANKGGNAAATRFSGFQ